MLRAMGARPCTGSQGSFVAVGWRSEDQTETLVALWKQDWRCSVLMGLKETNKQKKQDEENKFIASEKNASVLGIETNEV